MTRRLATLCATLLFWLAAQAMVPTGARADTSSDTSGYAICSNQTYALCATATAFVYGEVAYAKCIIKNGSSISAPPLSYEFHGQQKNICNMNREGAYNSYMMSTFSLPDQVRKGGSKALYTCPGTAKGGYAQCDGGTCFKSSSGQWFPGVGNVKSNEIICSCPITQPSKLITPVGYQFVGPYPCQKKAFSVCDQDVGTGSLIPVGSPPGSGRALTKLLYGHEIPINECK